MKRIEKFLDTAAYWKIFLCSFLFSSVFIFLFWTIFFAGTIKLTAEFSITLGIAFSLLFVLMNHSLRGSARFWEKARQVDNLIKNAISKEELSVILNKDIVELKKLSGGTPHFNELATLIRILIAKAEFLDQ